MTIVEDLIRDATASAVPVEELLRRLKVIAARPKTAELAAWVGHELQGYHASPELIPSYRGPFAVPAVGHFFGPYGIERRNEAIAPAAFPKEYRDVHQVGVNRGDEDALLAALSAAGVDPASMEELKKALAEDREGNGGNDPAMPGGAVSSWLGRLSLRAATAGGAVAAGAGGNVVSQLIMSYFGMG